MRVVTLNIWGLWLVSAKRTERVRHLADYLSDPHARDDADVVLLQEVWVDDDAAMLIAAAARGGLRHALHFRSGMFGSGLLTLSRWPIHQSSFHRYSSLGDAVAITCGDYYAAKGVGWARLHTPHGIVDVFNTHLHANYSHKYERGQKHGQGQVEGRSSSPSSSSPLFKVPQDRFAAYRVSQVVELAHWVRAISGQCTQHNNHIHNHSSSSASLHGCIGTILGGDLNTQPDSLEACLLTSLMPHLRDAWSHAGPPAAVAAAAPYALAGHTCKAHGNTFKPGRQVPQRIDYVLSDLTYAPAPGGCRLVLQTTPGGYSYSDHWGVQACMEWRGAGRAPPSTPSGSLQGGSSSSSSKEANAVDADGHTAGQSGGYRQPAAPADGADVGVAAPVYAAALQLLAQGAAASRQQGRLRLCMGGCMVLCSIVAMMALVLTAPTGRPMLLAWPVLVPAVSVVLLVALCVCGVCMALMGCVCDVTEARVLIQMHDTLTRMQLSCR